MLQTTFRTSSGVTVLRDALATGANDEGHDLGRGSPHVLLRELRCTEGEVEIEIEYAPRPEYGLIRPLLAASNRELVATGGASVLHLSGNTQLDVADTVARGRRRLRTGDRLAFALQHRRRTEQPPDLWDEAAVCRRLDDTVRAWESWSSLHQNYEGSWTNMVMHSGRVLQGLTYQPTGAIVAAATTSLPETVGGTRNWDYRYTWVRDASLTLDALWVAACPDEAYRFFDFLAATAMTKVQAGDPLQIMFGIEGEHDLSERELAHLSGWRESAPVRVGNGAWNQSQLDVYGELLAAADRLYEQLANLDGAGRSFLAELAQAAATRWREKDQGIWEIRSAPQHYLHSKLMCWVALDRAIKMSASLGAQNRVTDWKVARDEIRGAILARGWNEDVGAYTQAFGVPYLDAASLMMPIMGFLPATDQRMLSTIDAIEQHLTDEHGFVYRYRCEDGLAGEEGAFLLCTFWLAQVRAMAGQPDRAREIFERAAGCANDVGLLAEEVEPGSGDSLGNFPQAFSHIGLVNAAWAILEAEKNGEEGRVT